MPLAVFLTWKGNLACCVPVPTIHLSLSNFFSCTAFDVVLQDSIATVSCLECGKSIIVTSMSFGEQRDLWCQRCHTKLSLLSNQCHFVQHQCTGVVPTTVGILRTNVNRTSLMVSLSLSAAPALKSSTMKKDPTIQPGRPLPNFGACEHYKKSCRWLRYACSPLLVCNVYLCVPHAGFPAVVRCTPVMCAMTAVKTIQWREQRGCCVVTVPSNR